MFCKQSFLLVLAVLSITSWLDTSAFASSISFEVTHNYTLTLTSGNTSIFYNASSISGYSQTPTENWVNGIESYTSGSTSVSYSGGPWLNYMEAGNNISSAYARLDGTGPQGHFGSVEQSTYNAIAFTGDFAIDHLYFRDEYTYHYNLDNGSGNSFIQANWWSRIIFTTPGSTGEQWTFVNDKYGPDDYALIPNPSSLQNIDSGIQTGTIVFEQDVSSAYGTRFGIYLDTQQVGVTQTPAPGTLFLLGSGLIGIFGFGRRKLLRR